jgi:type III secretory pathway component EscS
MEYSIKNVVVLGVIAFTAVWLGNRLLQKVGAADLQA